MHNHSEKKHSGAAMDGNAVLVIGGGASGLMAAITAARYGAKVTLLEQNDKFGRKLNATGNGRCNFTNEHWPEDALRGSDPAFAKNALEQFSVSDTLRFFEKIGVIPVCKNGCYYPRSGQASSVTELLILEARANHVKLKTKEHVTALKKNSIDGKWEVFTEGWRYLADQVILSLGSPASQVAGSCADGYALARSIGHKIVKPLPALTGLKLSAPKQMLSKWAGVRTEGSICLLVEGVKAACARGELQLTDYGISGIPVFQVSRYAIRALEDGKQVEAELDFMPELSNETFEALLRHRREIYPARTERELLLGCFPDKLLDAISGRQQGNLLMKNLLFPVREGMPFSHAQAASGGVAATEINPYTMESKLADGLFFSGELIDIDGTCGGYNLQWAWSSGYVAGKSAAGKGYI